MATKIYRKPVRDRIPVTNEENAGFDGQTVLAETGD